MKDDLIHSLKQAEEILREQEIRHQQDQSALRESETRYRSVFEQSHEAIIITTRDGRFIDANPAALDLFGYSRTEIIGLDVRQIWQNPADRIDFQETIEKDGSVRDYEVRYRKKDGQPMDCLITTTVRRDPNGNILGYQGLIRDITLRKRMDAVFLHTQKLESLGILAGGIAHDFNNLLTVILGKTELILQEPSLPKSACESLKQIEIASQRAAELCKQMLAYSGKGNFVLQRLNLNILIQEMSQLLEVSLSKGVSIKYELAPTLPMIEVDATQIRQVVMNLIVNASEAVGERAGEITLTTGTLHVDQTFLNDAQLDLDMPWGDYVYAEVRDTGCGMDPLTRAKIFDPFFTTKFAGRGLGLAAVLGIVRGHGGAMKVWSEINLGSSFQFLLPCMNTLVDTSPQDSDNEESWKGQGTILVIDDESAIRTVTSQMIEMFGFETLMAADGIEGVEVFRQNIDKIVLVLLDLTMPKMSGEQTRKELLKIKPDIRIVLVSGYNQVDNPEDAISNGKIGFIQKPFSLANLRKKIQTMLDF